MRNHLFVIGLCVIATLFAAAGAAYAQPQIGSVLPPFSAVDIHNRPVNIADLTSKDTDLVILFFFTTDTGDEIALRLRSLNQQLGPKKVYIAAIGMKEDEAALKKFAEQLDIQYYVLPDTPEIKANTKYGPFRELPLTFIASTDRTLLKLVQGGGQSEAGLINYIAQTFLRRGQADAADKAADTAIQVGENAKTAQETKAYTLAETGKLDDAEAAFKKIDSVSGQADVELKRGNFDKAIALARQAQENDGYADTVLGKAYMRTGKLDDAEKAFGKAVEKPQADWQKSEALNGAGRISQQNGKVDQAIEAYKQAGTLDHYNIAALSNEGAAYRTTGNLTDARAVLTRAQKTAGEIHRKDALVNMMLRQVVDQMEKANNLKRLQLIQKQIADLKAQYDKLKKEGKAEPVDAWTSRPMVVAFLEPDTMSKVFFERAGTALTLKREVEMRLAEDKRVNVVDRDKLELLLQELQLGSSDLSDPDTQLRLGHVLAARQLGFIEFGNLGNTPRMNVRMVDTETTRIASQFSEDIEPNGNLDKVIGDVVDKLENGFAKSLLQGRIADASDKNAILINLGSIHGVKPGMRFAVIGEGKPITVGGRTIPGKPSLLGRIEVTQVLNSQLSQCKTIEAKEGATFAKDTKIREIASKP